MYAKNDATGIDEGLYCLLLCRVILGEVRRTTKKGGVIRAAITSGQYDSVLGDREASVDTYKEFVVYSEGQV